MELKNYELRCKKRDSHLISINDTWTIHQPLRGVDAICLEYHRVFKELLGSSKYQANALDCRLQNKINKIVQRYFKTRTLIISTIPLQVLEEDDSIVEVSITMIVNNFNANKFKACKRKGTYGAEEQMYLNLIGELDTIITNEVEKYIANQQKQFDEFYDAFNEFVEEC